MTLLKFLKFLSHVFQKPQETSRGHEEVFTSVQIIRSCP